MAPVSKRIQRTYAIRDTHGLTNTNDAMVFLVQPIHRFHTNNPINGQGEGQPRNSNGVRMVQHISPKSNRNALTFNHVAQKFLMPIADAAKELKVSKSTLKFRCRELGILKWPFPKLKSLQNLVETVVEFAHPGFQDVVGNLRQEIESIKLNPSLEIKYETKLLRQQMYDFKKKQRRIEAED